MSFISASSVLQNGAMNAINLADKLSTFTETFQPRTVGQFNGHDLMVVKGRCDCVVGEAR
jgi:hypothetical protein